MMTGLAALLLASGVNAAVVDFSKDAPGKEPSGLACVVGAWQVTKDGDKKVLMVNGARWSSGQPGANLADKARALYGARYAEFLDAVKAYSYFPVCVARSIEDFTGGQISFRFKPIAGRIDQGAGIVFNVKPNGDYLIVRANALEDNLVFFKYARGKRSSVKWVRNTPTQTMKWHDLKVSIKGKHIQGYLDGKLSLEDDWTEPISGRVGVWSKADSVVYFDDLKIEPK